MIVFWFLKQKGETDKVGGCTPSQKDNNLKTVTCVLHRIVCFKQFCLTGLNIALGRLYPSSLKLFTIKAGVEVVKSVCNALLELSLEVHSGSVVVDFVGRLPDGARASGVPWVQNVWGFNVYLPGERWQQLPGRWQCPAV